jgi:hypothetical protein
MKKFKKSIEINKENIWDVLKCPAVESIEKRIETYTDASCKEVDMDVISVKLAKDIKLCFTNFPLRKDIQCAYMYDVLALDICDTWYAFTKHGWDEHKNDEV